MATSGTTTFNLEFDDLIEEAYERCGLENRDGYDMKSARRSLNLLFLEWANRGLNLWTIEQRQVSMVFGQAEYTLPSDTVNVLSAVRRSKTSRLTALARTNTCISQIRIPKRVLRSITFNVQAAQNFLYIRHQIILSRISSVITPSVGLRMLVHTPTQRTLFFGFYLALLLVLLITSR
jgi:hypothetical protein